MVLMAEFRLVMPSRATIVRNAFARWRLHHPSADCAADRA
jgi:hypothetical protein